jgi:hypothetical protein
METATVTETLPTPPLNPIAEGDTVVVNGEDVKVTAVEVSQELEEPAAPAPAPEKLTLKQIRQLRRQYVTNVNGTVKSCGHKDNFSKNEKREGKIPNNNCAGCWEAYFMTSVDLDFIHTVLTTKGAKTLVAMKGKKFVRMFHGFLSSKMLPMLAAEIENKTLPEEVAPAQIVGGSFGNQGTEVQATGTAQ